MNFPRGLPRLCCPLPSAPPTTPVSHPFSLCRAALRLVFFSLFLLLFSLFFLSLFFYLSRFPFPFSSSYCSLEMRKRREDSSQDSSLPEYAKFPGCPPGNAEEGLINFAMEMRLGGWCCSWASKCPGHGNPCTTGRTEEGGRAGRTWQERDRENSVRLFDNFLPAVFEV